ncbi:uncharacterized protein LOC126735159 [Anthonomus grandis grandis]|uniref:uncharacterized protein LOC126733971 n=1 Tax=Anthonomus grandis grandis TaxID=2921223 RepID=UPI0021650FC6|nr:uncharacterized protein LOC126733971 [Anthonomus grandis grandis]XP_050295065.1 uncharacterized protein LOC126735159 [Anthonomus grandis grandis]
MNEKLVKELIQARQAVKRKLKSLKTDVAKSQFRQEKEFKPITEPLKELIKAVKAEEKIKTEPLTPPAFSTPQKFKTDLSPQKRRQTNIYNKYLPSELPSFLTREDTFEINDENDDDVFFNQQSSLREPRLSSTRRDNLDESTITEPTTKEIRQSIFELTRSPAYEQYLEAFHPLVRGFVDASLKSERDLDNTHGLFHDAENEKWKIGDSEADFVQQNFKIQDLIYEGTPGLYELLFFQEPRGYTSKDLNNYMDILQRSNAYRRNYDPKAQIQGTTDPKYLTIIKPYLIKKGILRSTSTSSAIPFSKPKPPSETRPRSTRITSKKGGGMMMNLTNKKTDYVYYDDPNELVERLKLLISSQMAGHTGHNNEIVSIIEELKEAKVIL